MIWYLEHVSSASKKALHHCDTATVLGKNREFPCPLVIPREVQKNLRVVRVKYFSFDGEIHEGQIVVHKAIKNQVKNIFLDLLRCQFPIKSIVPVVAFRWSDALSMKANNTSAFNYRYIARRKKLSRHAFGLAIDLNPFLNPCIENGRATPKGASYNPKVPGTITPDVVRIFKRRDFSWGGHWGTPKDYQHFEFLLR